MNAINFFTKYDALADKHLEGEYDNLTLIVKNHLLFEEMFKDYCIVKGGNPRNKTFYQILNMAREFCPENRQFDWAWDAVGKLNKIRNMVAHELEPDELEYAGLVNAITSGSGGLMPGPRTLRNSLAHLFGFMMARMSV